MRPSFATFVELLSWNAKHFPERPAFTFLREGDIADQTITFGELDARARRIAHLVQPFAERPILLCYPSGIEFICAFFGILYAGGIAVPVCLPRIGRGQELMHSIVKSCSPLVVLTSQRHEIDLGKILSLDNIRVMATDSYDQQSPQIDSIPELHGNSVAFIQYSSGSIGQPKGVMISHANILANQQTIQATFESSEESIGLSWLPHYHDMGLIGGILHPIYTGMHCYLMDPLYFLHKPLLWLQAISKYKVTVTGGPNFAYEQCLKRIKPEHDRDLDLSSWDVAFNGAEPVRLKTLDAFYDRFHAVGFRRRSQLPCYGLAESTLMVSGKRMNDRPEPTPLSVVHCGHLADTADLIIVDPHTLKPCKTGHIGEVWIASSSVALGYWGDPSLSEHIFQAYTCEGEGPFLRTGDLGMLDAQGCFAVVGRHKELMIFHGKNYYPYDIEHSVQTELHLTRLLRTAAFSVERQGKEQLVILQEVDRTIDLSTASALIRERVSEEHGLAIYDMIFVASGTIPVTTSGKIRRVAAKEFYESSRFKPFDRLGVSLPPLTDATTALPAGVAG